MALSIRGLCRLNVCLANSCVKFFKPNFINVGVRFMYTEQDLGIPNYENLRFSFRNQFIQVESTFREKMVEICNSEAGVIYSEDLKAMVHLAKATDDDMQLLNKMLRKYIANQRESGFGSYRFGPTLMRMYYHLDQPKFALEAYMDPELQETYNYRVVYRILISLLYKHKMFNEIKQTFEHVLNTKGTEFVGSNFIIVYAISLIENTPESLEYALKYWRNNTDIVHGPRSRSIVAALALKQNLPELALNILNSGPVEHVISIRSLKILTYVQLGRYIQIIPILKRVLENQNTYYQAIFADAVFELENKLQTTSVPEAVYIKSLLDEIKRRNIIQSGITLEEFILQPLTMKTSMDKLRKLRKQNYPNYPNYNKATSEVKSYM